MYWLLVVRCCLVIGVCGLVYVVCCLLFVHGLVFVDYSLFVVCCLLRGLACDLSIVVVVCCFLGCCLFVVCCFLFVCFVCK